jgi:hypothetical protein
VTTFEPGASVVLTQGLLIKPFSTAFFASSPAPIITEGFEVLVQEVIEAITTEPLVIDPFLEFTSIAIGLVAVLLER